MGFLITLENAIGNRLDEVADTKGFIDGCIHLGLFSKSQILRQLDPYGDTTFSSLQVDEFLAEWTRVLAETETQYEKDLIK